MQQILIVEDSDSDAKLLERALRNAGVTNPVHIATNGADAIAFLRFKEGHVVEKSGRANLGIVFIDLKLPDASGFELLRLLKGRAAFARTLGVMVSSVDDMENIRQSYALRADSFITKPVSDLDIKELIRSFPEHWSLMDLPSVGRPGVVRSEGIGLRAEEVQVWARHREAIEQVRETLRNLQAEMKNHAEMLIIVETLTDELRNEMGGASREPRARRKPTRLGF